MKHDLSGMNHKYPSILFAKKRIGRVLSSLSAVRNAGSKAAKIPLAPLCIIKAAGSINGQPRRIRTGAGPGTGLLSFVLLLFLLFPGVSVYGKEESVSETGFFLDTIITITLYGDEDGTAMDGCFDLLEEYEQMLSRTIEGSDVWKVNHSEGEPTEVSEETAALIETALQYSELSNGAFDITITPLVELWDVENKALLTAASEASETEADTEDSDTEGSDTEGSDAEGSENLDDAGGSVQSEGQEEAADSGSSEGSSLIPSAEEIEEALSHIGYQNVTVDGTTVTLSDPEAEIDLGGIAKGYIADRLEEYLLSCNIESALINLGGNVQTVGTKPDGSSWKIGIQKPFGSSSDIIAVIECTGESVVTSGTYERYFEVDGKIYHHILDPKTGYPTANGLTSVTILADSSTQCDALSTSCFVLGLENGMELIESLEQVEAMFITEDGTMYRTSGFPE
ncbi:MAG: FAD:protein FMN transferase [Lachnospiraceae bacterium]|nr:FAD:protein FMN transferase [Lachnospiraceae bacterium]